MSAEEARLRLALAAQVGNASSAFSVVDALAAICASTGLAVEDLTVKPFHPEPFLVCYHSQAARDRMLTASPIPMATTALSLRPWTRLANARSKTLLQKVTLELVGIPPHTCNLDVVSKLLSPFYWVEKLRETTVHKDDLRQCEVHAWTERPGAIPPSRLLRIAEKEIPVVHSDPDVQRIFGNLTPNLRKKRTLIYNVDFHLRRIADFRPRTPSTSSDSLSGDGDSGPDGNPERHYGFRQGHAGLDSPPFPGGTSARRDAAAPPALPQGLRVAPRGTRLLALLPARHKRAPLCYGTFPKWLPTCASRHKTAQRR
jgi:hypothetical protein